MNSVITILWYTAWSVAIPAFLIAWLATVGIIFRGFKSIASSKDGTLNALKKYSSEKINSGKSKNKGENKLSSIQIRNRGIGVFILCFVVILLISVNGLAPA